MKQRLSLAVAAVIRRSDGRFLLIRRAAGLPAAGVWTTVTGRPEPGESLEAAVKREVQEEVGLEVQVGGEVHRCEAEGAPYLLVWFDAPLAVEPQGLTPKIDEVAEARWVTPAQALRLRPMFETTREFFARK
jgi:ADP-ribose pyrophosphatase YjhB (NUDIX family)